ncbi:GNAT family N-acetyltransferase [Streptomyces sp. NPDC057910]|uniref:GNAT family N-acetyltransferase n=1 Tax=Streptomyces sp. NPDC057910 TaxID=3346278 RepID=UPI0036EF1E4D
MSKRTKKPGGGAKKPVPVNAARLRDGWVQPAGGRVRLIRPGEEHAADALMRLAGVELDPYLERAIGDGSIAHTLLTGLDHNRDAYYETALKACMRPQLIEGMPSMSLVLVAEDEAGDVVGVLAGMPAATMLKEASNSGYKPEQLVTLSLVIAKLQALAVAEHTRGQGLAGALLKRAWQIYQQLGFFLAYGQFDVGSGLEAFYGTHGFAVHTPGERLSLERINLPMAINAGPGEQLFSRWRPRG